MDPRIVINDVNMTLYRILRNSIEDKSVEIIFGSPADDEDHKSTKPRVYIFLYNIAEDPFHKNQGDKIIPGDPLLSVRPPMAVNLYYMLTPLSPSVVVTADSDIERRIDSVQSHSIIAQIMRAIYDNAVLDAAFYPANTSLEQHKLRISLSHMNLEETTKVWRSLDKPLRLSVCCEVFTVWFESIKKEGRKVYPVSQTVIDGVPEIDSTKIHNMIKSKDSGTNASNKNGGTKGSNFYLTVQPGMSMTARGRDLLKSRVLIRIDGKILDEKCFAIIDNDTLKVQVPKDLKPDKEHTLSINTDGEEINSTFIVSAVEPQRVKISAIRPNSASQGDIISIMGINFSKDAKVTVSEKEVSKMTFVDSSQINITIPMDVASGSTYVKVKIGKESSSAPFTVS